MGLGAPGAMVSDDRAPSGPHSLMGVALSDDGLRLRRVLSVDAEGAPVLDGVNEALILLANLTDADIGRMAVCGVARNVPGVLIVLGCLAADEEVPKATDAPLVLERGAASIALHPDGRIRVRGADMGIDVETGFQVDAGRIDLN